MHGRWCLHFIVALYASFVIGSGVVNAGEASAPPKRRILYNCDGNSCMFVKKDVYRPARLSEADFEAIADELSYPGSQVDTLLLCINAQGTFYPSRVGTMVGALQSGEARDKWEPTSRQFVLNLEACYQKGIDPYAVVIKRAKERGLEVLLTFRMNDAHGNDFLRCKFWEDNPDHRLGFGLDFGHQEVRDYTFALIAEAMHRYDCDGIELDFNRFPTFFKEGTPDERIEKINELVKRVREMVTETGKHRGKSLIVAARVPTSPIQCREIGLAPATWAEPRWIDFLTVAEFLTVDYSLPVAPWKQMISNIPIYGSIECVNADRSGERLGYLSPEQYRRAARHLWNEGADGIYLFNFFCPREEGEKSFEPPFEVLQELGGLGNSKGHDNSPVAQ